MEYKKQTDTGIIKIIFSRYNLGDIKGEPVQIKGDVDLNYKITTEQGNEYLLKYIVAQNHIQKFEYLGSVYEYLISRDIPVPNLCRTPVGNFIQDSCILFEYIEGEIKTDWTNNEIISLVNNFARLLLLLEDYDVPDFVKNNDDKYAKGYNVRYCHDVFKSQILKLDVPEDIKNPIVKTIDILYEKLSDFEKLPKQLIHGDLNEMNAIFKNGVNEGIIDFGVSYDPVVYDLGEFCYWFALPWKTSKFNSERYNLIIDIFQKILPLSTLERELLPYMILRRHMMDIMLALQHYWSNQKNMIFPIEVLEEKIIRNNELMKNIILPERA